MLKIGIRKLERETGVSHHTINKILKSERVRRRTLAQILETCHDYQEQLTSTAAICSFTPN